MFEGIPDLGNRLVGNDPAQGCMRGPEPVRADGLDLGIPTNPANQVQQPRSCSRFIRPFQSDFLPVLVRSSIARNTNVIGFRPSISMARLSRRASGIVMARTRWLVFTDQPTSPDLGLLAAYMDDASIEVHCAGLDMPQFTACDPGQDLQVNRTVT
jgi:hypothetical protein